MLVVAPPEIAQQAAGLVLVELVGRV